MLELNVLIMYWNFKKISPIELSYFYVHFNVVLNLYYYIPFGSLQSCHLKIDNSFSFFEFEKAKKIWSYSKRFQESFSWPGSTASPLIIASQIIQNKLFGQVSLWTQKIIGFSPPLTSSLLISSDPNCFSVDFLLKALNAT